jgi:RNA recognition motif-containing protein
MSKRIYVGNLPWSVTKEELDKLFSPFGEIEEALVVANKYTGRSRGFGFVTYKNDADADKAMSEMDKKEVEGRNIVVKEARPMREQPEEEKVEEVKKGHPREQKQEETQQEEVKKGPKKRMPPREQPKPEEQQRQEEEVKKEPKKRESAKRKKKKQEEV